MNKAGCRQGTLKIGKDCYPIKVKLKAKDLKIETKAPRTRRLKGIHEHNDAVLYLERKHNYVTITKVDMEDIRIPLPVKDVSRQIKDINEGKSLPIVLEYMADKKNYRIVDGEHRYYGHKKLGHNKIHVITQWVK